MTGAARDALLQVRPVVPRSSVNEGEKWLAFPDWDAMTFMGEPSAFFSDALGCWIDYEYYAKPELR